MTLFDSLLLQHESNGSFSDDVQVVSWCHLALCNLYSWHIDVSRKLWKYSPRTDLEGNIPFKRPIFCFIITDGVHWNCDLWEFGRNIIFWKKEASAGWPPFKEFWRILKQTSCTIWVGADKFNTEPNHKKITRPHPVQWLSMTDQCPVSVFSWSHSGL